MQGEVDIRGVLAGIWRELLPGQEVSSDSDFIDCGGTSVLAVHMAARVQEQLSVPLDAIDVVLHRTFARIAEHVAAQRTEHVE